MKPTSGTTGPEVGPASPKEVYLRPARAKPALGVSVPVRALARTYSALRAVGCRAPDATSLRSLPCLKPFGWISQSPQNGLSTLWARLYHHVRGTTCSLGSLCSASDLLCPWLPLRQAQESSPYHLVIPKIHFSETFKQRFKLPLGAIPRHL